MKYIYEKHLITREEKARRDDNNYGKYLSFHELLFLTGKSYTQETYLTKHMQKHAEKTDKRLARQNNNNHHQTNGNWS